MEKKRSVWFIVLANIALVVLMFISTSCSMKGSDRAQVYKNDKYGISITGPEGWDMYSQEFKSARRTRLVKFGTVLSAGPEIEIHQIDVLAKLANAKTPLEYAKAHVAELQKNDKSFVLLEGPVETSLNNNPVVKAAYKSYFLRFEHYYFSKNNSIFELGLTAQAGEFDKFRKWFDECINTLTLK